MQNFPWGLKKHPEHALYQTALHMKCCLFQKQLYTFTRGVISVSCPLITDLWEAKKRSDSYHKDISITIKVHGIFDIPTPYPETLTLERMLPYIFPLFGCLVSHLESISTLRRKLLLFIRNFLKKKILLSITTSQKGILFYHHPYQTQVQRHVYSTCGSSDRLGCCNPVAILCRKQNVNAGMLLPRPPLFRLYINSVTPC